MVVCLKRACACACDCGEVAVVTDGTACILLKSACFRLHISLFLQVITGPSVLKGTKSKHEFTIPFVAFSQVQRKEHSSDINPALPRVERYH